MPSISDRIRMLRGDNSRELFAKELGLSVRSLVNYELGDRTPNTDSVMLFSERLGISSDWLLFGEEPKYKEDKKYKVLTVRTLGERLRELRGANSTANFAEKINVSAGALNNYENDKTEPNLSTLIQISELYKVRMEWLALGKEPKYINEKRNEEEKTANCQQFLENKNTQAIEITDSEKEESADVSTFEERIRILEEESKETQKQLIKQLEDHNKLLEKYAALLKEHGELGVEMERLKAALAHKSAINGELDGHAAGYVREPSVDKAG